LQQNRKCNIQTFTGNESLYALNSPTRRQNKPQTIKEKTLLQTTMEHMHTRSTKLKKVRKFIPSPLAFPKRQGIMHSFSDSVHIFEQDLNRLKHDKTLLQSSKFLSRMAINIQHLAHLIKLATKIHALHSQIKAIEYFLCVHRSGGAGNLIDAANVYGDQEPSSSELALALSSLFP